MAGFARAYKAEEYDEIWERRCDFGIGVDPNKFASQKEWYWFNAYAALAGLELGKEREGGPLSVYCGLADRASNASDPEQRQVTGEINRWFFEDVSPT